MKDHGTIKITACVAVTLAFWLSGRATAYDSRSQIYSNLSRSRDALLGQRAHLQDAAYDVKLKLDNLQKQLDTINQYLTDTDAALRDVETAMNR